VLIDRLVVAGWYLQDVVYIGSGDKVCLSREARQTARSAGSDLTARSSNISICSHLLLAQ
jgi:hypothetical protein